MGFFELFGRKKSRNIFDMVESGDAAGLIRALAEVQDPNTRNEDGYTLISIAVLMKQNEILKILLEKGADVNAKNAEHEGGFPIHDAAMNGNLEVVRLLLGAGADVNISYCSKSKSLKGRTPLMFACGGIGPKHFETIELLLKSGSNPNAKDAKGRTPLMHLVDSVRGRKAAFLFKDLPTSGSFKTALSVIGGIVETSKKIEKGEISLGGNEAEISAIKILLEAGADINSRDNSGMTAIMLAKRGGDERVFDFLERNGATFSEDNNKRVYEETPDDDSDEDHEPGTEWQLYGESMFKVATEPWPPHAGEDRIKILTQIFRRPLNTIYFLLFSCYAQYNHQFLPIINFNSRG